MCDSIELNRIAIPKWESQSELSILGIEAIPIPEINIETEGYFQLLRSRNFVSAFNE